MGVKGLCCLHALATLTFKLVLAEISASNGAWVEPGMQAQLTNLSSK
jgi:hypothetical protein